jgi:heat shock protein HtpX
LFFSPTVAVMLQLALSRTREFNADRGAAELTGDAHGLASALKKLDRMTHNGMLGKLLRPGQRRQQPAMLRTHPPTEDRIAALMEVAQELASEKLPDEVIPRERRIPPVDKQRVRQKPKYRFLSGLWR